MPRLVLLGLVLLTGLAGCNGASKRSKQVEAPPPVPAAGGSALRGTIGEMTFVQGIQKMRVRGYGLVAGLGKNGSRICPEHIRQRVASEMRSTYRIGDSRIGLGDMSAEKLIGDPDTSVVLVTGDIGAGAVRGTRFDLQIQALPETDTVSLEGGRLYACDLRYYRSVDMSTVQEGKVIARGEGPVFLLPDADDAGDELRRSALIIAGGVNQDDRRLSLQLVTPSYALAARIQDRINTRFGEGQRLASAQSPGLVTLDVPASFQGRELEFLNRVQHLFLSEDSESRAPELIVELEDPQAAHDSIGLALEGIGQTVRPLVRPLYDHKISVVRFIGARTGLRLGDEVACAPLEAFARSSGDPFQLPAIAELGAAQDVRRASRALTQLTHQLDGKDERLALYEALLRHEPALLEAEPLDGQTTLDVLPVRGPPLIYVKTHGQTRIAVLGDARCRTPMFYKHPRGLLQISAQPGDDYLTVFRQTPRGLLSPPSPCRTQAADLIRLLGSRARQNRTGDVTGLGISFSQIVEVLRDLCADGSLDAELIVEPTETLAAPAEQHEWIGRPGSEL
jgi:flagellar basal body P-ring protein FlgI